jgi:hypothetical protein
MSSNLKELHTYFYSLQENLQRSLVRLKKKENEKEKGIIELIIIENHGCDPKTGRR